MGFWHGSATIAVSGFLKLSEGKKRKVKWGVLWRLRILGLSGAAGRVQAGLGFSGERGKKHFPERFVQNSTHRQFPVKGGVVLSNRCIGMNPADHLCGWS